MLWLGLNLCDYVFYVRYAVQKKSSNRFGKP